MKEEEEEPKTAPDREEATPKKAWERPRIQSGRLFEANTVSCAKLPAQIGCVPVSS